MANLFDYLEKGWDYVSDTAEDVYDYASDAVKSGYEYVSSTATSVGDWYSDNKDWIAPTAGFVAKTLYGEDGVPTASAPKAPSAPGARAAAGSSSYSASAADLGYTARVRNAARVAQNAKAGGSVQGTIQRLASRPSRGPLLRIEAPSINVRNTTKSS